MIGLDLVVEAAEGAVLEKEEAAVWKTRWRAAAAYSKRGPPPCCSEPVQANATQQMQGTNPSNPTSAGGIGCPATRNGRRSS